MADLLEYQVLFSAEAQTDMFQKAEYIENTFQDSGLAYTWYMRLRDQIVKELSFLPYKYQVYDVEPWNQKEVHLFLFRNDVVLYSIDEDEKTVTIRGVFSGGSPNA